MSVYESTRQTERGIASAIPVLHVSSLEGSSWFYQRLGFEVRRYDAGYAYAQREGLAIHLRLSDDDAHGDMFVETTRVEELHDEWSALEMLPIRTIITPDMRAELRRRAATGQPIGCISERLKDQPWGVREFSLRDPDGNWLRFGRTKTRASTFGAAA